MKMHTLELERDTSERVRELAAQAGLTKDAYLSQLLTEYLDSVEPEVKPRGKRDRSRALRPPSDKVQSRLLVTDDRWDKARELVRARGTSIAALVVDLVRAA